MSFLRLDLSKLEREEIDDSLPLAQPHTPKEVIMQAIADGAYGVWGASDYETESEGSDNDTSDDPDAHDRHVGAASTEESEQDSESDDLELSNVWNKSQRYGTANRPPPVQMVDAAAWKYAQQLSPRAQTPLASTEADEILELKQLLARSPRRPQAFLSAVA